MEESTTRDRHLTSETLREALDDRECKIGLQFPGNSDYGDKNKSLKSDAQMASKHSSCSLAICAIPQNENFAANCSCLALNIVLGEPKLEFGSYGINRLTFGQGPTGNDGTEHVGSESVIGVGAKAPA